MVVVADRGWGGSSFFYFFSGHGAVLVGYSGLSNLVSAGIPLLLGSVLVEAIGRMDTQSMFWP